VDASVRRRFPEGAASPRDRERYVASLHLDDLALATACALGRDAAWEHFVLEFRPALYRAADALDPAGGVREIADALYGDLYGVDEASGERRSLFRYFHGRSSLATWLRSVLAQRYVDTLRARKRMEPLEDHEVAAPAAIGRSIDPDRDVLVPRLQHALRSAIDQLAAKDRLRLRSYHVTQLTLAEIGRITGEHEATVSRHLTRTRRRLREATERHLREQDRLRAEQITRAFELAVEDPGELDLQQALDTSSDRKESPPDRSR
jgi:RNA polymerase sigma-70 factor (ECF subfamily)